MSESKQELPERPAEGAEGGEKLSKNALKKLAKDKEKAEKAAKRKEEEQKKQQEADANDVSKDDYGDLPATNPTGTARKGAHGRTPLESLSEKHLDTELVFRTAVTNAREQSAKLTFLLLEHNGASIQAVVAASDSLSRQMVKFAKNISAQSQVLVHGLVKKPMEDVKSATISGLEIHVKKLYVIVRAEATPLQVEDCRRFSPESGEATEEADADGRPLVSLNARLNNRTIDLRADLGQAIMAVKAGVKSLFSEYLLSKGFVWIETPKLLGASTEGGASVFPVKYFQSDAFLAQSPQFYKQMAITAHFERVFEIGPVFRAENSNTNRHLTEFTGLDLEMVFEENYHEVLDVLEELMLFIFNGLRKRYAGATNIVKSSMKNPIADFKIPEAGKVPRIHFKEGIKMLRDDGVEIGDFDDPSTAQEKRLGQLVLEKYGSDFYILDQYPLAVRPFYTMPSPDAGYSNSYDFHMRGQEILSGAQRVNTAPLLRERLQNFDPPINPDAPGIKEYVDAFRYGCPPHGGAGLGLERIVMLWLGLPNIRYASMFPRDPGRLSP